VSLCNGAGSFFNRRNLRRHQRILDYGPLGTELKRNVKELWWRSMTQTAKTSSASKPPSSCIRNLEASGHTSTFSDPM